MHSSNNNRVCGVHDWESNRIENELMPNSKFEVVGYGSMPCNTMLYWVVEKRATSVRRHHPGAVSDSVNRSPYY